MSKGMVMAGNIGFLQSMGGCDKISPLSPLWPLWAWPGWTGNVTCVYDFCSPWEGVTKFLHFLHFDQLQNVRENMKDCKNNQSPARGYLIAPASNETNVSSLQCRCWNQHRDGAALRSLDRELEQSTPARGYLIAPASNETNVSSLQCRSLNRELEQSTPARGYLIAPASNETNVSSPQCRCWNQHHDGAALRSLNRELEQSTPARGYLIAPDSNETDMCSQPCRPLDRELEQSIFARERLKKESRNNANMLPASARTINPRVMWCSQQGAAIGRPSSARRHGVIVQRTESVAERRE